MGAVGAGVIAHEDLFDLDRKFGGSRSSTCVSVFRALYATTRTPTRSLSTSRDDSDFEFMRSPCMSLAVVVVQSVVPVRRVDPVGSKRLESQRGEQARRGIGGRGITELRED